MNSLLKLDHLAPALRETVGLYWRRLLEADGAKPLLAHLENDPSRCDELVQVWIASDYVATLCIRSPVLLLRLIESGELERRGKDDFLQEIESRLAQLPDPEDAAKGPDETLKQSLRRTLRLYHQGQMLRIIWRDVCGKADVVEVCADMSALADASLHSTLSLLHRWQVQQWGEPRGEGSGDLQSMVVIGMGKLGAHELNLSSDIDLIFAFPEAGETRWSDGREGPTLSNQQYFTRLGQTLIDMLDTVTSDGFVFRVDMRLRPYGSEGALVCSFDAMEDYYQAQGRDWERYAMIKARICAGNQLAGAVLLSQLRPFVYRRYLDFSAFDSLRSMKMQINKQVRRKGMTQDIKLGPGGIREIEFVVQALQLVHGGRVRALQQAALFAAMDALVAHDYLGADAAAELREAYLFLRRLEHRLQGLANKQTQSLVSNPLEQQRIALAMGYPDWAQMMAALDAHRDRVSDHFRDVIHSEDEDEKPAGEEEKWLSLWRLELSESASLKFLTEHDYEDPAAALKVLREFRESRNFQVMPGDSRLRFDRFMPVLLRAVSESDAPAFSLGRVMTMVEAVSRRTAYLILLLENPGALRQLIALCAGSPFITEFLSRHPVLLDELLGGISQPPEKSALQAELQQQLLRIDPEDFEEQMECLRYFKQSHTLQVAAAQISGKMTVMKVSDYLTFTAEAVLEQVLALSWDYLARRFGYPVNTEGGHGEPDFVIIAYGKLGGIELSYVSDLDLVFLHRGALDQETVGGGEGQRRINSREFYTRLAQRIIMMLSTYTVSGKLYEVDMRLRPSGESGLLVSSLDAFRQYQQNEAWTWEHQALVRSRAVSGSPGLQAEFNQVRAEILGKHRDLAQLREDVVQMRLRMREELTRKAGTDRDKPPFVIKQGPGGIVDIEFIVQYLVLGQSATHPALLTWSDNVRILEAASQCSLLGAEDGAFLTGAYLALRSALHRFALEQHDLADPMEALAPWQAGVIRIWNRIMGEHG